MVLAINGIADINLDSIKRVAIDGESIELFPSLLRQMDEQRSRFVNFVEENHDKHMYGITTAHHIGAKKLLSTEARQEFSRRMPPTPPKALLNIYNDILSAYPCDGSPTNSRALHRKECRKFL